MIIKINFDSETPIYLQLRNQVVIGIGSGSLTAGEGLPTVRQMASDLGINTMTVNKAYSLLKNEGFISIDRRKGAKVCVNTPPGDTEVLREKLSEDLSLVISEAGLKGVGKKDFLNLCADIFDSMKGICNGAEESFDGMDLKKNGIERNAEGRNGANRNGVNRNGIEIWL